MELEEIKGLLSRPGATLQFFATPDKLLHLTGQAAYQDAVSRDSELLLSVGEDSDSGNSQIPAVIWGEDINMRLTLKCPLECSHCSVDAGPDRLDQLKISPEELDAFLKTFHARFPNTRLVLTGGEPALHKKLFQALGGLASELELAVAVETSAFWAPNQEAADRYVANHAWIGTYYISWDLYHAPFLNAISPIVAYRAAVRAGKIAKVRTVVSHKHTPAEEELLATLREQVPDEDLEIELIVPVGRAVNLVAPTVRDTRRVPLERCPAEGPHIRETGVVHPCCSGISTLSKHALTLGTIGLDSPDTILQKYDDNSLLHCLRLWGIPGMNSYLARYELARWAPVRFAEGDTCLACYDLFSQDGVDEAIAKMSHDLNFRFEVAVGRALLLGEEHSLKLLEAEHFLDALPVAEEEQQPRQASAS
jgi:pyruvate-formate lyase-activating enzyme